MRKHLEVRCDGDGEHHAGSPDRERVANLLLWEQPDCCEPDGNGNSDPMVCSLQWWECVGQLNGSGQRHALLRFPDCFRMREHLKI